MKKRDNYLEIFADTAKVTTTAQESKAIGVENDDLLMTEVNDRILAIKRRAQEKKLFMESKMLKM